MVFLIIVLSILFKIKITLNIIRNWSNDIKIEEFLFLKLHMM